MRSSRARAILRCRRRVGRENSVHLLTLNISDNVRYRRYFRIVRGTLRVFRYMLGSVREEEA